MADRTHAAQNIHSLGRWQSLNTFLCIFYDSIRIYCMYEYAAKVLKTKYYKRQTN